MMSTDTGSVGLVYIQVDDSGYSHDDGGIVRLRYG